MSSANDVHTAPPPIGIPFGFFHVSDPGSPGFGTVLNRHTGEPSASAERADPALHVVLAAGRTDQHEVLEDERRHREGLAFGRLRHLPRPQQRRRSRRSARAGSRRASPRTTRPSLIATPRLRCNPRSSRGCQRVPPLHPAGRRVERDGADHRRHVHRAVVDDRAGLEIVALADLEHAGRREPRRRSSC